MINIMNVDASINEAAGPKYAGLDRYDARAALWADLEEEGLAISADAHNQRVPRSQRGGEMIEPRVSAQWFVRMERLGAAGAAAVRSGELQILPARFEKEWFNWLDNIEDWCISRQLWWGHRVPVWYPDEPPPSGGAGGADGEAAAFFVARDEDGAREQAAAAGYGGGDPAAVQLTRDNDVLDTWFSSGLWPFATLGWPQAESADLARFYPTQCLETGYDILFFWVARMVMLGIEFTGQVPFDTIFLHGLVRDAEGQKMSKTKGNVIDPIDTIDEFGADALRYALVTGVTPGQDVPLSQERIEGARNFANKVWNGAKFVLSTLAPLDADARAAIGEAADAGRCPIDAAALAALPLPERYIVSRAHALAARATASLEAYAIGDAGARVYEFFWDEFADWYVEIAKTRLTADAAAARPDEALAARRTLVYCLDLTLRVLHPFMPYITEALWQQLPPRGAGAAGAVESLMLSDWPQLQAGALEGAAADGAERELERAVDDDALRTFSALQDVVRAVRNARAEYQVQPGKKIAATLVVADDALRATLADEAGAVATLAKVEPAELAFAAPGGFVAPPAADAVHLVVADGLEAYLPMRELVDAEREIKRLTAQAAKLEKEAAKLEGRLNAPGYVDKAKPEVVQKTRDELAEKKETLETIARSLATLREAA